MRRSRSRFLLLPVLLAAVLLPAVAAAQTPPTAQAVDVIKVQGAIDRPLFEYLSDALDQAVAEHAVVVLELNTSGTIGEDGVALAAKVASLPVPVLTWTGPVPARASGAGLLLMYAASLAGVAPGSQTGPLLPLDLRDPSAVPSDLSATIDGWLAARGRTVDRSNEEQALNAQQALDGGYATVADNSVLGFLDQVDQTQVQTPEGPVTLHTKIATSEQQIQQTGGVQLRFIEPGPIKRIQHGVASPTMVYVLLILGIACLAFEATQPGFGFAGFAGIFLLALAGYGIWIVPPTSWFGAALFLGGIGLLGLDVRLRRLGVLTGLGLLAFLAGSLLLYRGVAAPIRISPWLIGGAVVATLLYYGFGLTVAIQSRDRILSTQRGLIGLTGEARGRLAPDGPVYVKGALWRGRSLGEPIAPGSRVRVRGVDGLILKVVAETGQGEDVADQPFGLGEEPPTPV
ncbi:MAG: NfeD family protein [Planctomycetaceae bacterium]